MHDPNDEHTWFQALPDSTGTWTGQRGPQRDASGPPAADRSVERFFFEGPSDPPLTRPRPDLNATRTEGTAPD
jgi:hypothetical protein